MGYSNIQYFKRFKQEIQKKDLEIFNTSKYYNKGIHETVDFLSDYIRVKKPKNNDDVLTISDLESNVKIYCSSCDCSNEHKEFCANNLFASLQLIKDVEVLKKLYCKYKCSQAINDLSQNFVEFGIA